MSTLVSSKDRLFSSIQNVMTIMMRFRIVVTVVIIAWGIFMSQKIVRQDLDQNSMWKYFNFHRVWFGEESIVMILFSLWFKVFLIIIFLPLIQELINIVADQKQAIGL